MTTSCLHEVTDVYSTQARAERAAERLAADGVWIRDENGYNPEIGRPYLLPPHTIRWIRVYFSPL